jgi:tryptophan synthase beta chain
MPLILDLERAYRAAQADPAFAATMDGFLDPLCRPAEPALFRRAPDRTFRRREDLLQARRAQSHRRAQDQQRARPDLLALRMGKTRIIAETGAGQHGVATATSARASVCNASSSWARSMSSGRSRTCSA